MQHVRYGLRGFPSVSWLLSICTSANTIVIQPVSDMVGGLCNHCNVLQRELKQLPKNLVHFHPFFYIINIAENLRTDIQSMNNSLTSTVDSLNATINAQTQLIAQLNQTIQELKEQLNKNSKNSSKPPSSDGFKKPAPKSLRKPSGKKAGGQNGHQGTHLAVITAPDKTQIRVFRR